jgi:hypothetical protein
VLPEYQLKCKSYLLAKYNTETAWGDPLSTCFGIVALVQLDGDHDLINEGLLWLSRWIEEVLENPAKIYPYYDRNLAALAYSIYVFQLAGRVDIIKKYEYRIVNTIEKYFNDLFPEGAGLKSILYAYLITEGLVTLEIKQEVLQNKLVQWVKNQRDRSRYGATWFGDLYRAAFALAIFERNNLFNEKKQDVEWFIRKIESDEPFRWDDILVTTWLLEKFSQQLGKEFEARYQTLLDKMRQKVFDNLQSLRFETITRDDILIYGMYEVKEWEAPYTHIPDVFEVMLLSVLIRGWIGKRIVVTSDKIVEELEEKLSRRSSFLERLFGCFGIIIGTGLAIVIGYIIYLTVLYLQTLLSPDLFKLVISMLGPPYTLFLLYLIIPLIYASFLYLHKVTSQTVIQSRLKSYWQRISSKVSIIITVIGPFIIILLLLFTK